MSTEPASFTDESQKVCSEQVAVTQDTGSASGSNMGKLFGDLTNCSIGHITINVNPNIHPTITIHQDDDDKYDEIVSSLNLDIC